MVDTTKKGQQMDRSEHTPTVWFGGVSGIVFVALFLADIFLTPGEPEEGTPASQVATFYASYRAGILTTSLLHDFSGIFFLIFLATLFTVLWRSEQGTLSVLAVMGALVAGAVAYGSYVAAGAAAYLADHGASPEVIAALAELRYLASNVAVLPLAVFLAAASLIVVCRAVVPRWIGWLGLVAAAAEVASIFALYDSTSILGLVGFLGAILFAVWMLATSVGFLLKRSADRVVPERRNATT